MTTQNDNVWDGAYKIPWDDADFSRCMLAEHLSQGHDLASRRTEWINAQVQWIHESLLESQPARVLDLGCGPGFYCHRLGRLGHICTGIDFGPASIDYAQQNTPESSQCEFQLGDIRKATFGGPYDLAMILYGEFNVFAPDEAQTILHRASAAIRPGGVLILEAYKPQAIAQMGNAEPSQQQAQASLFSDMPHSFTVDSRWLEDQQVAVQTFTVSIPADQSKQVYRSTTKAWANIQIEEMLSAAGLGKAALCSNWPGSSDDLQLWTARME